MQDYMRALHERFRITSKQTIELGHAVEESYDSLRAELSREQQKLLIRFLDAAEHLRDAEKLDSFVSGFRLAYGVRAELGTIPAYSFEDESEDRAREIFEREWADREE